jgi:Family of unknown function (DUF6116)
MAVSKIARGGLAGAVIRWSLNLRFPYLVLLLAVLFVLNLFIPDVVPFADEIIMGLVTAIMASLKKKPEAEESNGNDA